MKLKELLLIAITVFSVSCQEDDENNMDFKITGLRDTVIERGQQLVIPVKVFYLGGTKQDITLSASGNGGGVSISYDPPAGKPDFSSNQYITAGLTADTGTYTITVTGTGASVNAFSKSFILRVNEISNGAPTIFLSAGDTVVHTLNSPWFDPGYTATDPEDGDLTSQVQVTGSVNVNLMGSYLLTYEVTDSDGTTTTVTRLVRVLNNVVFLNGQYTCTTFIPGQPVLSWITTISASTTVNNDFKVFKISDFFGADPLITFDPATDSIFMAPQTFICATPTDTLPHTFSGSGKVTLPGGSNVGIELVYTDSWTDSSGNPVTLNKRDIYNK